MGERAISPPVRRVRWPPKSSPVGVVASQGASSSRTSSITPGATTRSTMAQPSLRSAAATSAAGAEAAKRSTGMQRP